MLDGYPLQIGISIVMYTALATSWLLFSGPTNYIALATAAFFGIGMYTAAGGIDLVPYPVLIVAAGIAGAALAAVVGLATLRVSGVYFVIFSLGLAELVRQVMTWLQHVLGTMSGLYVTIERSEPMYYWQLLLLAAVIFLVGWLDRALAARLCAADHRQRRIGRGSLRHQHGAGQGGAVHHLQHIRLDRGCAGCAALGLCRAGRRLQSVRLVSGGDHGAAWRHASPVGAAARGHSVHAGVGIDRRLFPQPDDFAARRMLSAHRLCHSERAARPC